MNRQAWMRGLKLVALWIPALFLAMIFLRQGWSKFSDASGWAVAFRHWGYPDWFRIMIGAMEVAGSVLLLTGRAAAWGASLITIVMLGAMGTHLVYDQGRHLTSEILPLTLALVIVIARRHQLAVLSRPVPRPRS